MLKQTKRNQLIYHADLSRLNIRSYSPISFQNRACIELSWKQDEKQASEIIAVNSGSNVIFNIEWLRWYLSVAKRREMGGGRFYRSPNNRTERVNSLFVRAAHTVVHDASRRIIARCINNDVYLGVIYKQMYLDAESFTCRGSFYTGDISANYPHRMLPPLTPFWERVGKTIRFALHERVIILSIKHRPRGALNDLIENDSWLGPGTIYFSSTVRGWWWAFCSFFIILLAAVTMIPYTWVFRYDCVSFEYRFSFITPWDEIVFPLWLLIVLRVILWYLIF